MLQAYLSTADFDFQTILLVLGIVMNTILGALIFIHRRDEFINKIYLFNIICIVWWSVMIVFYRLVPADLLSWTIWLYVAPTFIASSFLYFVFFFPEEHAQIRFRPLYFWLIVSLNVCIVVMTLIPGVIIDSVDRVPGSENIIHFGPYYLFYASYISGFFGLGLLILARKLFLISDRTKRRQLVYLLWGYLIASTLAMFTNLTLPYLGYFEFNWLGQVLTVFMVLPVTYAIFKHHLFDVKVIATELTTILLWIFLLARLLLDLSIRDRVIDMILLAVVFVIGLLLIRSVEREVEQRERIEKLAGELEVANRRQENLIHFISHEIKGYLTKSEATFAAISQGDFGVAPPEIKELSERALADVRKGVETVMDILSAGDFKKGTIAFTMSPFDLRAEVSRVAEELRPAAQEKGLSLELVADGSTNYAAVGDAPQLHKHVFFNLIDNAVKYTPHGGVRVTLSCDRGRLLVAVKDTGVGIPDADRSRLFTEGGRGANSIKVNAHSTGYGLFIAKSIVEAHHGRIWYESAGEGKGTTFYVELPAKNSLPLH